MPAPGFVPMAEDNEAFVSEDNMVLSFQAHPEIMGEFATMVMGSTQSYNAKGKTQEDIGAKVARLGDPQDGLTVLRRILEWVGER